MTWDPPFMDNDEARDGSGAPGGGSGAPWSIDNDTAGGSDDALGGFNPREIGGGSRSQLTKINMNC